MEHINLVIAALEEIKATDIKYFDVKQKSTFADFVIIATGNSSRQLKSLANNVCDVAKNNGVTVLGIEGLNQQDTTWVLIDLGYIIVHIMTAEARDFYELDTLWC